MTKMCLPIDDGIRHDYTEHSETRWKTTKDFDEISENMMKSTNEIPFSSVTDNPVWMADMMYVYNLNTAAPERSV